MFGATVLGAAGSSSTAYQIANSLRFDGVDDYLSRTFGTPTLNTKFYLSCKLKRAKLGVAQTIISSYNGDANNFSQIYFDTSDRLVMNSAYGGTLGADTTTSSVFRDPTAWLLLEFLWDGSLGTVADRSQIWVNGVRQSVTGTNGAATIWHGNTAVANRIGLTPSGINQADFYLADVFAADGQSLTLPLCAELDSNNVWVPKAYTGSYGNNGFHLDFADGTSTTTLGYDAAGSNDWTLSAGMTRSAGVSDCWTVDSPTNNFAVLNPIRPYSGAAPTKGNLEKNTGTAGGQGSTMVVSSGKWYAECTLTTLSSGNLYFGICKKEYQSDDNSFDSNAFMYSTAGGLWQGASSVATYSTYAAGDTIGIELDATSGTARWYKNGIAQGASAYSVGTGDWRFLISGGGSFVANPSFGQSALHTSAAWDSASGGYWRNAPSSGFKSLCTANLPAVAIPDPSLHFDIRTYSGSAGALPHTPVPSLSSAVAFAPDLVWIKSRNTASTDHVIQNSVQGAGTGQALYSDLTSAAGAQDGYGYVSSFDANGFQTNSTASAANVSYTGRTYVSWLWKAGGTGVSNTAGTITSTVSANTTAGFSIVTYTGTGANATVGHGLGVAPKMVIVKSRSINPSVWYAYHSGLTSAAYALLLNATDAQASVPSAWNSTAPTSSVFSIGTAGGTNNNASTYVAYCFAEIPGYSKFGSYVGNGSADGPFVHCGFRPRWVMIKSASNVGGVTNWTLIDTARSTYNVTAANVYANASSAEDAGAYIDVTANGFKVRNTFRDVNDSTGTMIYAAFAEHPFGGSNVSPAPAR